ncbi:TraB family protein [Borrelia anserina]|uniref:Pheromone shutdown protein n=2 Tax=Borrelia anserina TaxID=143 RepID=W5SNF2_BORAN|nr:TraB family protein [Borrelia anserina]AHH08390.1 Pheromone shutdown protein [Borrelia anserina BA2]APR64875.1 pheromone shutdown protein [Borrelia anserina Es]UPA06797.1 TraB family protein [Borrelia anserina]
MNSKKENNEDHFSHVSTLDINHDKIYILGTAHVSKKSSQDTATLIETIKPDFIAVELDEARYHAILETDENEKWRNLDIYKVIKQGKTFLLIVQIILSNFQKKLAKEQGINPGEEMKTAILKSKEHNIPLILADRKVETTLKRAWNCVPILEKVKIISSLFSFSDVKVTKDEIEKLKEQDVLSNIMEELAKEIPNVKKVLIDERDEFIASKILEGSGKILAVVGAGHVKGIIANLKEIKENKKIINIDALNSIPKTTFSISKLISYLITIAIVVLMASSFYFKGFDFAYKNLKLWIIYNSVLAGLAALLLRANIITVLTASIGAPIFSLIPFIGTGMVAGLVEAYINKPKIKDFEKLQEDLDNIKGYFRNKVTKILLIVFFVNIGSAIGTIVGFKSLLNIFS